MFKRKDLLKRKGRKSLQQLSFAEHSLKFAKEENSFTSVDLCTTSAVFRNRNKNRGGTSDATALSSLIISLIMMSFDDF